jgi:hypothetical protein
MKICLNPARGGHDSGAVGSTGLREADVALRTVLSLRRHLAPYGLETVLTREDDSLLYADEHTDLRMRIIKAISTGSEAFVSIHCEAGLGNVPGYTAVHYVRGDAFGAFLAWLIQQHLAAAIGPRAVAVLALSPAPPQLARIKMPAVLVDLGFLTDRDDEALLWDEAWIDKVAAAIAAALHSWQGRMGAITAYEQPGLVRQAGDGADQQQSAKVDGGSEAGSAASEAEEADASTEAAAPAAPDAEAGKTADATQDEEAAQAASTPEETTEPPDVPPPPQPVWVVPVMRQQPNRTSLAAAAGQRAGSSASQVVPRAAARQSAVVPPTDAPEVASPPVTAPPTAASPATTTPQPAAQPETAPSVVASPTVASPAAVQPGDVGRRQASRAAGASITASALRGVRQQVAGIRVGASVQTAQGRIPIPAAVAPVKAAAVPSGQPSKSD